MSAWSGTCSTAPSDSLSLGGYSFKILILGAGQAVEATTALCFSAGPANLLITWGTFFALAFFGILAANLNLKVKGDK